MLMFKKNENKQKVGVFIFLAFFLLIVINNTVVLAACPPGSTSCLDNPITGVDDPRILIGRIIKGILGLSGSIALLMFVYGGIVYLTAQGERERIERAKNTLTWATVGLAVIFGSYAFLGYVFKMFVSSGV